MKTLNLFAPACLASLAVVACGPAADATAQPPAVTDTRVLASQAWCRPTPNGARTGACYVTLTASGGSDRLVGITTPAAGSSMVHLMSQSDGMMRMSEARDGVALPSGQPVSLAPGGTHLMLMQLKGPLVAGARIPLTLDLEKGPDVTVEATIRQP